MAASDAPASVNGLFSSYSTGMLGKDDFFNMLHETSYGYVRGICMRYMRDPYDADDMAATAFSKAYQSFGTFGNGAAFSSWLYQIAKNVCLTEITWRRRRQNFGISDEYEEEPGAVSLTAPESTMPDRLLESEEALDEIRGALTYVDERFRDIVEELFLGEDVAYDEIAKRRGIPVGTVKSRASRGRRQLQEMLSGLAEEYGIGTS